MSPMQTAREDEEIRAVPLQRLVPASSRVLPFPSRQIEMSHADRMIALDRFDPFAADLIRTTTERLYNLLPEAAKR